MRIPRTAVLCLFFFASPLFATTYVVNDLGNAPDATPGDNVCATAGNVCTLYAAIQETNAHAGADAIRFSVAGTITPSIPMSITGEVDIDATTAPGYAGTPVVTLTGVPAQIRFDAGSNNSILAGLKIGGTVTFAAVLVDNTSHIIIRRNHLGPIGGSGGSNGVGIILGTNSTKVTIGGSAGNGNVISGNGIGIIVHSSNHVIANNVIGTNATIPPGHQFAGIELMATSSTVSIGSNVISANAPGVLVRGTGHFITANSIVANTTLGIDLDNDGVTANDPLDVDSGANGLQNFPVITSAVSAPGASVITGSLHSLPTTSFSLHFYSNAVADPSGFGEGETYLGMLNVISDAAGNAPFTFNGPGIPAGHFVTATASGPTGTSEFSEAEEVTAAAGVRFSSATYTVNEQAGTITITVIRDGDLTGTATVDYATSDLSANTPSDYAPASGTLTFDPGVTSQTFDVAIVADFDDEPSEAFNVALSNATGALLEAPTTAMVVITDPRANLSILKSASFGEGANPTFLITVSNMGPDPATNVAVTDTPQAGSTVISATPSTGTCTVTTTAVCTIPTLEPGASMTIEVVTTPAGTRVTNVAAVTASEIDPDPTNNTSAAPADVAGVPTASTWALMALAAMLGALAIVRMRA